MKARVKATGKIIEIIKIEDNLFIDSHYYQYEPSDIEWEISDNDYWTRLEHTYAGMAMQGIMNNPIGFENIRARGTNIQIETALLASEFAHALVEKMKEAK